MDVQTLQTAREIAADVLGMEANGLTAESSPENVEGWDSVQQLNLVLAIEQRFDVEFGPEEIDELKNLGAIAAAVDRKRARSTS